jgi:hypothetical protein
LLWNVTLPGTYTVKTCWSGGFNFSGSESEPLTVFVDAQQPPIQESSNSPSGYESSGAQSSAFSPAYLAFLGQSGKEFLKDSLVGTNIVLSGDFMILSDGHEPTPSNTSITIPAHQRVYRMPRSRRAVIVEVPEETITLPWAELLNNQFGFILKSDGESNYTASVKLLTDTDVSQITQSLDESKTLFLNASDVTTKNAWHKAVAKVSGDKVTVEVYDENGKPLGNRSSNGLSELCVLMTYPVGQVLAFKNLKVEALDQSHSPEPVIQNQTPSAGIEYLFPYVRISLLLAGVGLAVLCLKERRANHKRSESVESPSIDKLSGH